EGLRRAETGMAPRCRKCRRVNPAEAVYCYFDGVPLDGVGGPRAAGALSFPHPLFLPSGRTCHTFDQLALAFQEDWQGGLGQRRFTVRLQNEGMRLLYGSVTCDGTPWLAVGEPAGPEKMFHFRDETVVPVAVCGDRLRASPHPLEGRLVVSSNGGSATVIVR